MKLYLISQKVNNDYDTYDSAVVVAKDEEEAKKIHPDGDTFDYKEHERSSQLEEDNTQYEKADQPYGTWARKKYVQVEYLGEADEKYKEPKVICSSFNAG